MSRRALDAIGDYVARGGEPDDVLRSVVRTLAEEPDITWAAIAFLEEGDLTLGPTSGEADESRRARVPVTYRGAPVGELWVDGNAEKEFLEQVAGLVSNHVLIGWDTRGEAWEP